MNINELTNLKHVIYFAKEVLFWSNDPNEKIIEEKPFNYENPVLLTMGYLPTLDSNGNTQLEKYVYYKDEWIKVNDDARIKLLDNEHLLEAVFYLLQETTRLQTEIDRLAKRVGYLYSCRY